MCDGGYDMWRGVVWMGGRELFWARIWRRNALQMGAFEGGGWCLLGEEVGVFCGVCSG